MGDSTEKELETRIFNGTFDFEDEMWDTVSSACKDLIVRMLTVDPAIRISVDKILKHAWITHEASESKMITAPNKLKPLMNVCFFFFLYVCVCVCFILSMEIYTTKLLPGELEMF